MFKAQREQILQRSVFRPYAVNVLDAWKDENGSCLVDYKTDSFPPHDIPNWLDYEGEFSRRRPKSDTGFEGAGIIRLLLCETPHWHPLSFSMKKEQFCAVEKAFDLPEATLPLFESRGSVHTWSIHKERLYFVMKVQQQNPIANYGLSFCHDLNMGTTTGILYGLNLTCQQEWYGTGYSGASRVDEFLPQLKELGHLLDHPLLLPILLLGCDIRRAQHFCMTEIEPRLLQVEDALRVTRPGQITGKIDTLLHEKPDERGDFTPLPFDEDKPYYQRKPKMIRLMAEINTLTTESLIALCVPSWQTRFAKFLATFFDESSKIDSFPHKHPRSEEVKDMMNHFASAAANNMDYMQQLKSRMELQLQVLYQFMTQTDNHLNATLAAAATRDSSAMKTLAFLTALFLPGTYVAALFSMDMFDWSGSNDSNGGGEVKTTPVSSSFWIYWIVTGILTFAVIGGWRLWWKKENRRYKEQYKTFLGLFDKKNDERSSRKDECVNNGYHAAREESEDDENDEDDAAAGTSKLRGGVGDDPVTWLSRAGHVLGLDQLRLHSNRSIADACTEAEPTSTQSDLAIDVEAGLERPADEMEVPCDAAAEQQPPAEQQYLTIPPKNRRRYSQNLPARHHHPYYLNRRPDRLASSRSIATSTHPASGPTSGESEIPALPPPPSPPPRRYDVDSYSRCETDHPSLPPGYTVVFTEADKEALRANHESKSPLVAAEKSQESVATKTKEQKAMDAVRRELWNGHNGLNDVERSDLMDGISLKQIDAWRQKEETLKEPTRIYQAEREMRERDPPEQARLPPPPPGAERFWCGTDDLSWLNGPGIKEHMGTELWDHVKLEAEHCKETSKGKTMQAVDQFKSEKFRHDPRDFEGDLSRGWPVTWGEAQHENHKKDETESAAASGSTPRETDESEPPNKPHPDLAPPGAWQSLQNSNDDLRWLDNPGAEENMGTKLWDYMKQAAQRWEARDNCARATLKWHESQNSRSLPFPATVPLASNAMQTQVFRQGETHRQWYEEQKRKYLRLSIEGEEQMQHSICERSPSSAPLDPKETLGVPLRNDEIQELSESEKADRRPGGFIKGWQKAREEPVDEELYSQPSPSELPNKAPRSPPLPAGPLVVVPGQLERRSSLILSPHPSNNPQVCSPRFPTYQEPWLDANDNKDDSNDGDDKGPEPNSPSLPEPSHEDVQQRLDRLSTHPPIVRHLSVMSLQAQKRGWAAPQIKRWKEWHLGGLARQWCRLQQRQLLRQGGQGQRQSMQVQTQLQDHHAADASGGYGAQCISAATQLQQISPLSPIPPIRLEGFDLDLHSFDMPLTQDGNTQEQEQEQERMRTATRTQMEKLKFMARESEAGNKEQEGNDEGAPPSDPSPSTTTAADGVHRRNEHAAGKDNGVVGGDGNSDTVASSIWYPSSSLSASTCAPRACPNPSQGPGSVAVAQEEENETRP